MARTALFSLALGALIAWNWGRLEEPHSSSGPFLLMIVLAVVPALLPEWRLRLGAGAIAFFLAGAVALDVRPYAVGKIAGRAGGGFLDYYDVLVPFDPHAHKFMHGVLLLAVFLFTFAAALAVAARRPLAASLFLVAGAGWPATILPGGDDLGRGAFLLGASLALIAWLDPEARRAPPQILAGTGLVILALIASSSGAIAKDQFLGWQNWDLSTKAGKRVSVEYVWRANYNGIRFPRKRTQVFTVRAPERSVYWRATTLDTFTRDRWDEDLISAFSEVPPNPVNLTAGPLLPDGARDSANWSRADITIDALRDAHLVGPPQPVQYDSRSIDGVQYARSGVALALPPPSRGADYTVWGYTPQPKPSQLAKSPPDYPPEIALGGEDLGLGHGVAVPTFGTAAHREWALDYFANSDDGRRYRPLYDWAVRNAGRAKNPYAAAVALEAWFRSSGGFTYDEHPPRAHGVPPLVQFVTTSKRGYCQHFAGAMALMLRYLGIPARVAAGFTSGRYDSPRGEWAVSDRDAHTWVEVWFRGFGWLPFDPTPGRGTLSGSYTSSSLSFDASGAAKVLTDSALAGGRLLRLQLNPLIQEGRGKRGESGAGSPDRGGATASRSGGGMGTGSIVFLVALALAILFVVAKVAFRWSRFLTSDPRRVAGACSREVVDFLKDQRIDVPRSAGPSELGALLANRIGVEAAAFVSALGLARFGPDSSATTAANDARRELRSVRRRLRRALPFGRRVRGLFSIRSLLST